MMASENHEYRKLVRSCSELRVAFQDHMISLTEDLHAASIITQDNKSEVLNPNVVVTHRASTLVDLIANRVKLEREKYHTFVRVLKGRNQHCGYKAILQILGEETGECTNGPEEQNVAQDSIQANLLAGVQTALHPSMTDEQFFGFLQNEGVPEEDCEILKDNKIKAKIFITYLHESDFDSSEFGSFTPIGRRILKQLWQQFSYLIHRDGYNLEIQVSVTSDREEAPSVAPSGTNVQNSGPRRIEIGSGSLRGNLFGGRKDYYYDVPDGVKNVSLSWEDKSDNGINFGSENGEVRLDWDKAAKKAHVHAWVNGSIGSNHVVWTVYAWI